MRQSIWAVVALTALTGHVLAQSSHVSSTRYRWRDAQEQPHFSDSLSNEALKNGYEVINDQGFVVQRIPHQLSPEKAAIANQQVALQAEQERQAQQAARRAEQLLAAYPNEASYKHAQQMTLDRIDQQMNATRINLDTQEKALAELLDRAGELEHAKQPVPQFLSDKITTQRDVVGRQRHALTQQQALRGAAANKSAAELEHYRSLRAAQAQL